MGSQIRLPSRTSPTTIKLSRIHSVFPTYSSIGYSGMMTTSGMRFILTTFQKMSIILDSSIGRASFMYASGRAFGFGTTMNARKWPICCLNRLCGGWDLIQQSGDFFSNNGRCAIEQLEKAFLRFIPITGHTLVSVFVACNSRKPVEKRYKHWENV